jgi:lysozyme family protein
LADTSFGLPADVEALARKAFRFILSFEKGTFTNDPNDPGGPTKFGVSWRAVKLRDKDRDGKLDFDLNNDGVVDERDIRMLTEPDAWRLFIEDYWNLGGDKTPYSLTDIARVLPQMAFIVADGAYNMGPRAAVAVMQTALGRKADGIPGPMTQTAVRIHGMSGLSRVLAHRLDHYRDMSTADIYFVGWARRVVECGIAMAAL